MALNSLFSPNGLSVGNLFNPTDVVLANGDITAGNTVTANYFLGNGAFLTGIAGGSSYSNANVAAYLPNYGGNILTNVVSGNFYANSILPWSPTSGLINDAVDIGNSTLYFRDIYVGNVITPAGDQGNATQIQPASGAGQSGVAFVDAITGSATDVSAGSLYIQSIDATGNVTVDTFVEANEIIALSNVSGTGGNFSANVTAAYFLGNGAFLTGISSGSSYSNANVKAYLGNFDGNIIPSANITYDLGSNTNRWNDLYLNNSTIYIGAQEITANASTTVFSGNIAANYLFGNASFLSGVSNYSNANVAAYLPNYQGLISNVDFRSASNTAVALVVTDRPLTMGGNTLSYVTLPDDGNANSVAAELTNHGLGNVLISAGPADYEWIFDHTGNLTLPGSTFAVNYANGQQVSLSGTFSNTNVKAYLESGATINANFGGGTLRATGTANLGPTQVNGNLTVAGNITASGNVTYINVQDLVIDDPLIFLGATNPADTEDLGIVAAFTSANIPQHTGFVRDYTDKTWKVFTGVTSEPNTVVAWNEAVMAPFKAGSILSNATITANANVTAVGNVSGSYLLGNGYFITGLPAGYSNSDVANYLASNAAVTILTTGNITTAANIVAGNITTTGSANIAGNLTAGNLLGTGSNTTVAAGSYSWVFDNAGNLTLAGNTFAVNYANGTQISFGTSYSNSNAAAYLASNAAVTILTTSNITTAANITGNYILGNGSLLTGIITSVSNINNGTSNIRIDSSGGNILANVGGTANVVIISNAGINVAGYVSASGNVSGGNITTTGMVSATGNITSSGNISAGNITATGNLTAGNLLGSGSNTTVAAGSYNWVFDDTGNLTLSGNTFAVNYANGQQISLGGTYSNSTVANYLASNAAVTILTTGNITSAANITANYLLGNGYFISGIQYSNIAGSYSNANVANYLPTYTGNVGAGNFVGSGDNVTISAGAYTWTFNNLGNLSAPGNLTATGNVTGNYILGNGSLLTGIITSVSNINNGNSNIRIDTSGGNILANVGGTANAVIISNAGINVAGYVTAVGNITTSANVTANNVITTGNVTSGNFVGSGANVNIGAGVYTWNFNDSGNLVLPANTFAVNFANGTPVTFSGTYSNANVAAYLPTYNGNALFGNVTVSQDAVILGNLRVEGTTTYINVTDLIIEDKDIIVAANASATMTDLNGAGLQIGNRSAGGNITFFYNSISNVMSLSHGANIANVLNVAGNITATGNTTSGNVNLTGNIVDTGALSIITGAAGNITLAPNGTSVLIATTSGVNIAGYLNTTGNISAGNVIGSGTNVEVAAGIYNWIFDNTGNLTLAGNTFAVNYANGQQVALGGSYSNSNVAAYLASNAAVTILTTANITTAANIAGNYFIGNGALLTGVVTSSYSNANVANYLPTYTGNVGAGNLNLTGNIVDTGALSIITGAAGNITLAPNSTSVLTVTTTGVNVSGTFNATGNISAGNLIGSGNNVEVTAGSYNWVFDNTGNATLAGNTFAVNYANGQQVSLSGTYSNSNVAAYLASNAAVTILTTGNITTAANVTANYLLGNGYFVTGIQYANITGAYGNANVKTYLESGATINANFGSGNITTTGTANLGITQVNGNLVVTGNISATGNITYINVSDLVVSDPLLFLAANNPGDTEDIGLVANYNPGGGNLHTGFARDYTDSTWKLFQGVTSDPNTVIAWNEAVYAPFKAGSILSNATITANANVVATGNVSGTYLLGNGYFITGIQYSNITGAYSNATVANYLASNAAVTILTTSNITSSGNVAGNFLLGNIRSATGGYNDANVAAYTGALTNLTGNVTTSANVSGAFLLGNIRSATGGYGDDNVKAYLGNFDGNVIPSANITYSLGSNTNRWNDLYLNNSTIYIGAQEITANADSTNFSGNISAGYIFGNGAFLTGVTGGGGSYGNANVADYLASNANITILTTGAITTSANVSANNIVGYGSNTTITTNGYRWSFNNLGNLVLPGNTFAVNYANGTQVSLGGGYSNANVKSYLGNFDGNIIPSANVTYDLGSNTNRWNDLYLNNSTVYIGAQEITANESATVFSGNIAANYLLGNGALLTGVTSSYGNANVKTYLESGATINANFGGGTLRATGIANLGPTTVNGNLVVSGNISATGDISANNLTASNVVTAEFFYGDGIGIGNLQLFNLTSNISTTGNVTAGNYFGNIRSTTGGYGDANVATYLPTYTGNGSFGNLQVTNNVVIFGNLQVLGNTTTINANTLSVNDKDIIVANNAVTADELDGAGLQIGNLASGNIQFFYNFASNVMTLNRGLTVANNLSVLGNITGPAGNMQISAGNMQISASNILLVAGSSTLTFNAAGNVTGSNNITANYYYGDISNTTGGYGNNSVTGFLGSNSFVPIITAGQIITQANLSAEYLYGNGYFLTGIASNYSNANVAAYLQEFPGNIIPAANGAYNLGNNTRRWNEVYVNSTLYLPFQTLTSNSTRIIASSSLSAYNFISTNDITAAANITATGNVSGSYVLGNIRFSTGGYNDANVAAYTGALTNLTGNVTTTANVQGGYILGNIRSATGGYNDANVAAYTGALTNLTGNVTTTANVQGGYILGNIRSATGGYNDANVAAYTGALTNLTGNVTTTANVQGAYVLGNGAFLTGIAAGYSNADVANYLPTYTGALPNLTGNVITTANVSGAYILGNGYFLSGISGGGGSTYGNANVANYLASNAAVTVLTTANITTAANVAGNYFIGNGAFLTGISAGSSYGNANVADYLASNAAVTITTTANISSSTNVNAGNFSGTGSSTNIRTGSQLWTFGSTGTLVIPGNINANNYSINNLTNPVQDQDAATKIYVDNLASTAISYHEAVLAATTTTLAVATGGTVAYNQVNGVGNGIGATLTTTGSFNLIDTANVQTANTRILVKNEANGAHNGVYVWSNATAITRASTENTPGVANVDALGINDYFYTTGGNINKGSAFIVDAPNTAIVFGTSNIQFAVFSQSQVYSANTAAGISLATTTISAKVDNDTTAFDGGGNISVKASANLVTPNIGAATGTSLSVTGNITSSANVAGNYFIGNGAFLTGISGGGTYGNSNVAAYLASNAAVTILTTGNITTSANITANNFIGAAGSDPNVGLIAGTYTWNFDNTGNLTLPGNTFAVNYANGQQISLYSNSTVANYLPTYTGNVSAGNLNLTGNIIDTGAIAIITGAAGNISLAPNGSNTIIATTTGANVTGTVTATGNITTSANIAGTFFIGNGAFLTGIAGGGGGSYGNSNVADYLASNAAVTILTTGNITTAANVRAGNFLGSASNTTIRTGNFTWTFDQAGNLNINSASGTIVGSNANTTIQTGANRWNFASDGQLYLPGNLVVGYRDIPQNSWTGTPTIALADLGEHYYTASGGVTINIPANSSVPLPIGAAVTLINQSGANCTIGANAGVTLYLAGNATTGNRTLAWYGFATLVKVATDTWFVNGSNVI